MAAFGRTGLTGIPMAEGGAVIEGVDAESRVFTFAGLLPRTSYTLSVMAVNAEGQVGPPATIEHTTVSPEGKYLHPPPLLTA